LIPDDWNEFVSGCGSRQAALHRISVAEDGYYALFRRQVAEQPTPAGASAREAGRIAQLGQLMVERFRETLITRQRVATGLQPPAITRIEIPNELWSKLLPNLEDGTAEGGGYAFAHVRVIEATDPALAVPEIVLRMAAWLAKRREQHGDEKKEALLYAARDEFRDEFKIREFDVAYRRIYEGNEAGRPVRKGDNRQAMRRIVYFCRRPVSA
jgi:hypothetical protein